jgi:hypothetical protein
MQWNVGEKEPRAYRHAALPLVNTMHRGRLMGLRRSNGPRLCGQGYWNGNWAELRGLVLGREGPLTR